MTVDQEKKGVEKGNGGEDVGTARRGGDVEKAGMRIRRQHGGLGRERRKSVEKRPSGSHCVATSKQKSGMIKNGGGGRPVGQCHGAGRLWGGMEPWGRCSRKKNLGEHPENRGRGKKGTWSFRRLASGRGGEVGQAFSLRTERPARAIEEKA